jgi:hypothetical protein
VTVSETELETLRVLQNGITKLRGTYERLNGYYEGQQRLEVLGLAVPPALQEFTTIVNWPRLVVDAVDERLDVEGFRYPQSEDADDDLWRVWQANDLDEESQLAHVDAMVFGRSFVCVGTNENDDRTPIVTVESPQEMEALVDPRTRKVVAALRLYGEKTSGRATGQPQKATLYLPNSTLWLERSRGRWTEERERDDHGLGVVPVVPLVNRSRTAQRGGVSEMADSMGLTDACARALTNAQVAAEALAVPQRGVLGASKGDFVDANGQPLTVWETYFGAVWALENPNAKTFQFDAAQLSNFETIVNLYARLVASMHGLPPHYLGFTTDNPASADAIRSAESRLVKRAERKQRAWSGSWEEVMRLVLRFQSAEEDVNARRLETLWRDPSTPTKAQAADATVKLVQANVLPREAAWEDLGYSAERRKRLAQQFQQQTDAGLLGTAADLFRRQPVPASE